MSHFKASEIELFGESSDWRISSELVMDFKSLTCISQKLRHIAQ